MIFCEDRRHPQRSADRDVAAPTAGTESRDQVLRKILGGPIYVLPSPFLPGEWGYHGAPDAPSAVVNPISDRSRPPMFTVHNPRTTRSTSWGSGRTWRFRLTENQRTTPSRSSTTVAGRGTSWPSAPPCACTRP